MNRNLNTEEKISRSRIQLQRKNPFFAYLSLFLKFREAKKGEIPEGILMGVDAKGNVFYNKKLVGELDEEKLQGTITHELGHLIFLTALRQGNRDFIGWNFATDLAINTLIKKNGFILPDGVLLPDGNDEFNTGIKIIKNISEKTAEEIYDEFPKVKMKGVTYVVGEGKGKGKELGKTFDEHFEGKGDGKKLSGKEKKELKREWENRLQEAIEVSRQKGNIPGGLERLVDKLHRQQIDWKSLLNNYITQQIPYNYSWNFPHKKSIAVNTYLPHILKEKIEVTIIIDLSGSIGQKEMSDFLSEIIAIAKAYQERISMRLITHETSVNDDLKIENGNIEMIKNLKLHGGGGTSHIEAFDYIKDKIPETKCAIFLTDGYSDIDEIEFNNYPFDKLFVITKDGNDSQLKGKSCQIIHLKD